MSNIDDDPGAPADRVKPDTSQPRNQLIAMYTLLAVGALFGVKFAADAYLEHNTRAVRTGHAEESTAADALAAYRSESDAALAGGEMSIDEAMSQLADRGRAAFVQIRPTSDESDAARLGWSGLPVAPAEAPPRRTRAVFTLSPEEMPPADPELEALESGVPAPAAPAIPAPRAPRAPVPPPG
jgi:hypothetical protein